MTQATNLHNTTGAGRDTRLPEYLLGAFGFSWTLWIPAGLSARNVIELPLPATALTVLGSFGPMVAGLAAAARHGGWAEAKALLSRLRFRSVAKRWVALALLLGAVTLTPAVAYLGLGGSTDGASVAAHLAVLPLHFLIVATIGGGLDEEVGWRGMAQPLLQQRLRPLAANLLLGLIWAIWHLPLWLDPDSAQAGYHFAVYTLVILGHSLITGYLYNASGGSLLIAVLAHSSNNTFDGLRYAILGDAGGDLRWQLLLARGLPGTRPRYRRPHPGAPRGPGQRSLTFARTPSRNPEQATHGPGPHLRPRPQSVCDCRARWSPTRPRSLRVLARAAGGAPVAGAPARVVGTAA